MQYNPLDSRRSRFKKVLMKYFIFSIIPLVLLLGIGEAVLRAFDFRYSDVPLMIRSLTEGVALQHSRGNPNLRIMKNKYMLWVSTPTWEEKYALEKPLRTTRIVTMGCSCTQGCANMRTSYANYMNEILSSQFANSYEVLNFGESGYSSYQGLQQLKYVVSKFKPDIVTIFFGWNDHWFGGYPDHLVRKKQDWEIDLVNFFEHFRIYQAYHWLIAQLKNKLKKNAPPKIFRVPLEKYEENLKAMVDFCRDHNIKPVLITAPFEASGMWEFVVFYHSSSLAFDSQESLVKTHMAYNEIVRKVGKERRVSVIDLEQAFLQLTGKKPGVYFQDGIHFSGLGCQLVAVMIAQRLEDFGYLESRS